MNKVSTTAAFAIAALLASPAVAKEKAPAEKPAFAAEKVVDDKALAKIAGREDINQLTQSDSNNSVTGNSVGDNSRTGTVSIKDQAFQNMNGLSILNANTGNNVAINATIQVNVAMPQVAAGN
ncbi:hypothetical protein [Erythrobacter sp. F6033]|uniref:hypothetical protein n=1 Tax=Erythrobacter sp. F6033 TaxID=2926401 RepID=UPI001FF6881B|nr:hypothetical protein [Erythrobacter sp. F6033]MCK0127364.1 hypothetical protein [Erythrobacter sp. F6033]